MSIELRYAGCVVVHKNQLNMITEGVGSVVVDRLNIRKPADWKDVFTNDENNIYTYVVYSSHGALPLWLRLFEGRSSLAGLVCLGGVTSIEYLPEICSNHEESII